MSRENFKDVEQMLRRAIEQNERITYDAQKSSRWSPAGLNHYTDCQVTASVMIGDVGPIGVAWKHISVDRRSNEIRIDGDRIRRCESLEEAREVAIERALDMAVSDAKKRVRAIHLSMLHDEARANSDDYQFVKSDIAKLTKELRAVELKLGEIDKKLADECEAKLNASST